MKFQQTISDVVSQFWNLDIFSNSIIFQRPPLHSLLGSWLLLLAVELDGCSTLVLVLVYAVVTLVLVLVHAVVLVLVPHAVQHLSHLDHLPVHLCPDVIVEPGGFKRRDNHWTRLLGGKWVQTQLQ